MKSIDDETENCYDQIRREGESMNCDSRQKTFEDLTTFQRALELADQIYLVTSRDLFCRDYALKNQVRRAAISVFSNIAEGFERGSNTEFIQFLFISKGSCAEARAQLVFARRQGYISEQTSRELTDSCKIVSSMIAKLITYLRKSPFRGIKYKTFPQS